MTAQPREVPALPAYQPGVAEPCPALDALAEKVSDADAVMAADPADFTEPPSIELQEAAESGEVPAVADQYLLARGKPPALPPVSARKTGAAPPVPRPGSGPSGERPKPSGDQAVKAPEKGTPSSAAPAPPPPPSQIAAGSPGAPSPAPRPPRPPESARSSSPPPVREGRPALVPPPPPNLQTPPPAPAPAVTAQPSPPPLHLSSPGSAPTSSPPAHVAPPVPVHASPPPVHAAPPVPAQASTPPVAAPAREDDDLASLMSDILSTEQSKKRKPTPSQEAAPPVRVTQVWYQEIFDATWFKTLPNGFHRRTLREVNFILDSLGVAEGAQILDLCCGFGRHTVEMARRGFDMAGLDLSMPLLNKALGEMQRRSLSIQFIHGDMRDLNFGERFDAVFNYQSSFGYFDDRTNFEILAAVHRALRPGGRFLIETINREWVVSHVPRRIWWEGDELLFMEEVDFEFATSRLLVKRSVVDEAEAPWEQNISLRLYSPHEIKGLLEMAGFNLLEVSGDIAYRGAFLGPFSRQIIAVAEKPVG